jgi:acyl carrier protein
MTTPRPAAPAVTPSVTQSVTPSVTQIVRECWAAALELPPEEIEASSNFFADGGDSMLAVELVTMISDRLGVDVPLDPLFFDGTFGALVAASSDLAAEDTGPGS